MLTLSPTEILILSRHPDELTVDDMTYLAHPLHAAFLAEYEFTWADVIASRRHRQTSTRASCSPSLSSSCSPSS